MSRPNKYKPEQVARHESPQAIAKAQRFKVLKARMARFDRAYQQDRACPHIAKIIGKLAGRARKEGFRA